MAEEWVNHAIDRAHKAKGKLDAAKKAHVEADKNLKETFAQLIEVEKSRKNAKAALSNFEKQVTESLEA